MVRISRIIAIVPLGCSLVVVSDPYVAAAQWITTRGGSSPLGSVSDGIALSVSEGPSPASTQGSPSGWTRLSLLPFPSQRASLERSHHRTGKKTATGSQGHIEIGFADDEPIGGSVSLSCGCVTLKNVRCACYPSKAWYNPTGVDAIDTMWQRLPTWFSERKTAWPSNSSS